MSNHNETTKTSSNYVPVPSDEERPFFSDAGMERRIAYDRKQTFANAAILYQDQNDPFKSGELKSLLRAARLTKRQVEVIRLRSKGMTFDEIGCRLRRTKQGAQRVFAQAVRKLQQAKHVYPFTGLNEVYRQEIHRGVFR